MAIKVQFEIGHSSKLKSKPTLEGFTHDWEVFVKGVDKSNISEYVDKVVFNLHESFRKPKRTVKEPPYVLKESGYAGFQLSIEIHFKNRNEPRKVIFFYDLDLNQTKPYHRSEKKDFIFENPSDDFRQMLKNGGGVVVVAGNTVGADKNRTGVGNPVPDERTPFVGKPKISTESMFPVKKVKPPKTDDHFTNLFGTPITKTSAKVSPDPAKGKISPPNQPKPTSTSTSTTKDPKSSSSSSSSEIPKEKVKKDKHKHSSPYKDKDSTSSSSKHEKRSDERSDKKKDKSHSKERGRSREKSSKDRPPSPPPNQPPRSSSAASREEPSGAKTSKSSSMSSSSKKSKKDKKEKDKDRDRSERREKEKEKREKDEPKPQQPPPPPVSASGPSQSSTPTIPVSSETPTSNHSSSSKSNNTPINNKRIEKTSPSSAKEPTPKGATPVPKPPPSEKDEKDKQRHKHKKKDKTRDKETSGGGGGSSTGGSKDHSSSSKEKRKEKSSSGKNDKEKETLPPKQPKLTPPVIDREEEPVTIQHSESSNSSFPEIPKITTPKELSASPAAPALPPPPQKKERKSRSSATPTPTSTPVVPSTNKEPTESKIKRRRESITVSSFVEPPAKQNKKDDKVLKNGHDKSPGDESNVFRPPAPATAPPPTHSTTTHIVPPDYMAELQELHHKIMTLQDNKELQQVVELIAETGNYEITSRTFDFDLCKLDRNTVQRLQDFFAASAAS